MTSAFDPLLSGLQPYQRRIVEALLNSPTHRVAIYRPYRVGMSQVRVVVERLYRDGLLNRGLTTTP